MTAKHQPKTAATSQNRGPITALELKLFLLRPALREAKRRAAFGPLVMLGALRSTVRDLGTVSRAALLDATGDYMPPKTLGELLAILERAGETSAEGGLIAWSGRPAAE